jgi:hypothetical protein
MSDIEAYSTRTGTTYPTWEALVEAEANGYTVTAIVTKGKQSWPYAWGPFPDKAEADKFRVRQRNKFKREAAYSTATAKFFVRPLWKQERE